MDEQGTGFITVNVRTAGGALPVEGAMITVKSLEGNEGTVVAVMYTDAAGSSDIVSLPAPPKENSLYPGRSEVCSFYTIDTDREGFYPVVNSNVAVYDGVTAIQQVLLVPIASGQGIPYPSDLTRFDDSAPFPDL